MQLLMLQKWWNDGHEVNQDDLADLKPKMFSSLPVCEDVTEDWRRDTWTGVFKKSLWWMGISAYWLSGGRQYIQSSQIW